MLPQVAAVLWIAVVVGLVLVIVGWRGRRVHARPTCRRCLFDLSGCPEGSKVCPECGSGLMRRRAVRRGVRRTIYLALVPGLLIALAPGVLMLALVLGTGAGYDVNQYKPTRLLVLEARLADGERAEGIAEEMLRRAVDGGLTESAYRSVIAAAIRYQGDWEREWSAPWGGLLEQAIVDGKLSPADRRRVMNQVLVFDWRVRPMVAAGESVPIVLLIDQPRLGPTMTGNAALHFERATLAGRDLTLGPDLWLGFLPAVRFDDEMAELQSWRFGGVQTFRRWNNVPPVHLRLRTPDDLPPGKHRLTVAFAVRSARGFANVRRIERSFDVVVVSPGGSPVELINAGGTGGALSTNFGLSTVPGDGGNILDPKTVPLGLSGLTAALIKSDQVPIIINALRREADTRILSSPRLLVDDNETAEIVSLERQPTQGSSQVAGAPTQTFFTGFEEAGTTLQVVPSISDGGYLRLQYNVELSNFVGVGAAGLPPPMQTRRVNSDSVTIPADTTIIVGGIQVDSQSKTVLKVPLLGDIPLIGHLFRDTGKADASTRLYIFITPRILRDPTFRDLILLTRGPQIEAGIDFDLPPLKPAMIELIDNGTQRRLPSGQQQPTTPSSPRPSPFDPYQRENGRTEDPLEN